MIYVVLTSNISLQTRGTNISVLTPNLVTCKLNAFERPQNIFLPERLFKELLLDDRRIISRMTMSRIQLVKVIFQMTRLFFNPNKIYVEMFRS